MKKELSVEEGNKLIEVFWISQGGKPNLESDLSFFESSFDMLIPVVEKIENMGCIVEIWLSLGKGCRIAKVSKYQSWQTTMESNSTIKAVWLAVVEFIQWYNNKN